MILPTLMFPLKTLITDVYLGKSKIYFGDTKIHEHIVFPYFVLGSSLRILSYCMCKLKKENDIVSLEMFPFTDDKRCSDLNC